jgi:hypothetical protein
MTVQQIAYQLPCRRSGCGARRGERCKDENGFERRFMTSKFRGYYKHHQIRVNDAKLFKASEKKLSEWNSAIAHQTPATGDAAKQ